MELNARTVFCDDIRREDSGKALLIGVYTEDLVPSVIPCQFPLSVWIQIDGLEAGNFKFELMIDFPGSEKFRMEGDIEVMEGGIPVSLTVAGFAAQISKSGMIKVRIKIDETTIDCGQLLVRSPASE